MGYANAIKKNLGSKIKEMRDINNISREELSEHLDIQPNSLGKIESGRNFVSAETLANLCKYFNVDPAFFFMKNPKIIYDENTDFAKEIVSMLPTLSKERLKDIYEIMLLFQKQS